MLKLLLIGCGPHARTFYVPALQRLREQGAAAIAAAVDLQEQRTMLQDFLAGTAIEPICVPASGERLDASARARLEEAVQKHEISGVIVSTDPLSHRVYAEWAIDRGLHLLLDKPVTTRKNAAWNEQQARGLEADYLALRDRYEKAWPTHQTAFILCAHRRYHPGLACAREMIAQTCARTGCPVTNIHAWHADGQWRLPAEMVTQQHHAYFDGHGKLSHSGYHFLDCVARFWQAGEASGKFADQFEVYARFVGPRGLIKQLTRDDYRRLFGPSYDTACAYDDHELRERFGSYGEIDAEIQIAFCAEGEPVGLASVSLLHNSFSRRCWLQPNTDLYKGNGRVKHEQHRVQVGPFLEVQIHSYQAKDRHAISGPGDVQLGGNNHFEILAFRNTGMLGGGEPLERITLESLAGHLSRERLFIEQIKEGAIREFIAFMRGEIGRQDLQSDIADHLAGIRLMAAAYVSHARRAAGGPPLVCGNWRPD